MLKINNMGFELLEEISDEVGSSGEEYEMLVSFSSENYEKVLEIAKETNIPLTVFAKVAKNDASFVCVGHHF
jgi:thiamine-monophosphate kinase